MNYRMKTYTVSDFISSSSTSNLDPSGTIDVSFLSTYVNCNEINQNLQNAPSNNQSNVPSLPFPHYHYNLITFQPWHPSRKLCLLLEEFNKKFV